MQRECHKWTTNKKGNTIKGSKVNEMNVALRYNIPVIQTLLDSILHTIYICAYVWLCMCVHVKPQAFVCVCMCICIRTMDGIGWEMVELRWRWRSNGCRRCMLFKYVCEYVTVSVEVKPMLHEHLKQNSY